MAWLSGWAKRTPATLDSAGAKVSADLTHFAVPLVLSASCGITGADMTRVFNEVGSNYLKIAITTSDGTTQLYGEVEQWDATIKKALIWVSDSTWTISSSIDDKVYIYYDSSQSDNTTYIGTPGNRTEVWIYDNAWLMADIKDSAGSLDGTATNTSFVDAPIGKAAEFQGDGYIDRADGTSVQVVPENGDFSLSAFINTSRIIDLPETLFGAANPAVYVYAAHASAPNDGVRLYIGGEVYAGEPIKDTGWRRCWLTRNGNTFTFYVDNTAWASGFYSGSFGTDLVIGASSERKYHLNADVSSIFLLKSGISASWRKADYHAQTDDLLTWGAEETAEGGPTVQFFMFPF